MPESQREIEVVVPSAFTPNVKGKLALQQLEQFLALVAYILADTEARINDSRHVPECDCLPGKEKCSIKNWIIALKEIRSLQAFGKKVSPGGFYCQPAKIELLFEPPRV